MSIITKTHAVVRTFTSLFRRGPSVERYGKDWWYGVGGANTWDDVAYLDAFNCIPELNAIINYKAWMRSNGRIKFVNDKGEEVDHKLGRVLAKPNWMQSQREFIRQTSLEHYVFGNEYVYPLVPLGFKPTAENIKAFYTLPANLVSPEYHNSVPFYLHATTPEGVKYFIEDAGSKKELTGGAELIMHLNDNKVGLDKINDKMILKGDSKQKALKPAINNITKAYETRGIILKYRGALGIISNASNSEGVGIPLNPKERKRVNDQYKQTYGGLDGQFSVIISNANLRWQQMSVNPDKLGLFQEVEEDFNKFLDAHGMAAELFVRVKNTTYENRKQAEKATYQNTIIPEAWEWIDGFNGKYMQDDPIKATVDYSHLPIFQEDLKMRGEALEKMVNSLSKLLADKAITIEEYQAELAKFGIGPKIKI